MKCYLCCLSEWTLKVWIMVDKYKYWFHNNFTVFYHSILLLMTHYIVNYVIKFQNILYNKYLYSYFVINDSFVWKIITMLLTNNLFLGMDIWTPKQNFRLYMWIKSPVRVTTKKHHISHLKTFSIWNMWHIMLIFVCGICIYVPLGLFNVFYIYKLNNIKQHSLLNI